MIIEMSLLIYIYLYIYIYILCLLDQKLLDEKVDAARDIMKQNAIAIQQMEGKNDVHGFSLKGLTATDLYNNTK